MSAGRRGLILSITFIGLILWISPGQKAHAEQRYPQGQPVWQPSPRESDVGTHTLWQQSLSPDAIRDRLARFGIGDSAKSNPFEDLLRKAVMEKSPNADPKQVDAAIKKLLANKELMDRLTDMAQKHKNQNPNGSNPQFTKDELAKLAQLRPQGPNGGDPFKVPEKPLPTWNPKQFDPKQYDPGTLQKFDPKQYERDPATGYPLDNKTHRPFDPITGQALDSKNPPKIDARNWPPHR